MNHFSRKVCIILAILMTGSPALFAQKVPTNKYSMKMEQREDGSYVLQKEKNYAKIVDLSAIPDLLVPYVHQNDRLTGKLYNKTQTEEFIYKTCDDYELKLAVDKAVTEKPAPVMFYIHGGGWARGNFDSSRSLSKYMAQQHGITGVRVEYTLAPQPGANVEVSIQDVLDAVQFIISREKELNIDPSRIGFLGTSAGGHLAAVAAMKHPGTKVFVGYSGIYDLTTAKIVQKTKDEQRIAYFEDRDEKVLRETSPLYLIPKKTSIAAQLFCGTCDITVECAQSEAFAAALKHHKAKVDLQVYQYYDHNLSSKTSDKMEEIFFKTADFIVANLL